MSIRLWFDLSSTSWVSYFLQRKEFATILYKVMLRPKKLFAIIAGAILLSLMPISASAQTSNDIFSGDKSSDYQPPTQNPQSDPLTGLQPNAPGTQNLTGQSNISQDQQNLPGTSGLEVLNNGDQAKPVDATKKGSKFNPLPVYIGLGLTAVAVVYVVMLPDAKKGRPRKRKSAEELAAALDIKPKTTAKPTKKPTKKSTKKPTKKTGKKSNARKKKKSRK